MKALRMVGVGILKYIGIIIFAVVIALATIFSYFSLQLLIFSGKDYLLFVGNESNMIPALMIMILIIYALIGVKEKLFSRKEMHAEIEDEDNELVDIENCSKLVKFIIKLYDKLIVYDETIIKVIRVIKISYLSVLIAAIYFGITSYAILYPGSIKVGSPIAPKGVAYSYDEIKSVNVGISRGYKNFYSPYYRVVFNNGKSVDFFGGSVQEGKDISFENILIDLDKELKTQGVAKNVDKENFEKYSKGLDRDFVGRVEKLFDDK